MQMSLTLPLPTNLGLVELDLNQATLFLNKNFVGKFISDTSCEDIAVRVYDCAPNIETLGVDGWPNWASLSFLLLEAISSDVVEVYTDSGYVKLVSVNFMPTGINAIVELP